MSCFDSELDAVGMSFPRIQLVPACRPHANGAGLLQPVLSRRFCGMLLVLSVPSSPRVSSAVVGKQPGVRPPVLDELSAPQKMPIIFGDRCPAFKLGRKLHHLAGSKNRDTKF